MANGDIHTNGLPLVVLSAAKNEEKNVDKSWIISSIPFYDITTYFNIIGAAILNQIFRGDNIDILFVSDILHI